MKPTDSFRIYLGLGSNRGESLNHLSWAIQRLGAVLDTMAVSSFYVTQPRDDLNQPPFVNGLVSGQSRLEAEDFLAFILALEEERGRLRDTSRPKGPRPLDIDILLWGRKIIDLPQLQVPHPRMTERLFVLIPLLELEPFLTDPRTGIAYALHRSTLPPQGVYYSTLRRLTTVPSLESGNGIPTQTDS